MLLAKQSGSKESLRTIMTVGDRVTITQRRITKESLNKVRVSERNPWNSL